MSPYTERMIRESWSQIEPEARRFSELFYGRLFEIDPYMRTLFAGSDLVAQQRKFAAMLAQLIGRTDDPGRFVAGLAEAGQRHLEHGAQDRDYETARTALLDALAVALGPDFTPELRAAWSEMYDILAAIMRRGANRSPAVRPPTVPASSDHVRKRGRPPKRRVA